MDANKFLPVYKTETADGDYILEDFKAKRRRYATAAEAAMIPFRNKLSPIILERAMKAHLGLEPQRDAWDVVRLGR